MHRLNQLWRVLALVLVMCASRSAIAADAAEAKRIFNQRCTACHTFGRGVKVGPDLKGVTARRDRSWLLRFIRSSQSVIGSRDPVAMGLFEQFRRERMPDWTDLSEPQIVSLLDWFAVDGPDQREPDERDADQATPVQIDWARKLFNGSASFANGGVACANCHAIRDNGETVGGSLGPNLTTAYLKFRDRALTLFLKQPCFRREPDSSHTKYLTPEEAFAIKAYLRQAALPPGSQGSPPKQPPPAPSNPPVTQTVVPINPPLARVRSKRGAR